MNAWQGKTLTMLALIAVSRDTEIPGYSKATLIGVYSDRQALDSLSLFRSCSAQRSHYVGERDRKALSVT
jgi:hypothetical protein